MSTLIFCVAPLSGWGFLKENETINKQHKNNSANRSSVLYTAMPCAEFIGVMEKLNIAKLLKDCPSGMELDCVVLDNLYFDRIDEDEQSKYPIFCFTIDENGNRNSIVFTENGYFTTRYGSKCAIFPKGKTTWEGFQRPFKDGDIIFTHANCLKVGVGNTWISIFKEKCNGGVATYVDYAEDGRDYYSDLDGDKALLCMEEDILRQRFATEEEKQKLFKAIKDNGYYWNAETKTLEKLIEPKFKVGDRIRHKTHIRQVNTVTEIKDTHYILDNESALPFTNQDGYELVPNKFDITTLKPFESRVLVRTTNDDIWRPAIYGFTDSDRYYVVGGIYWKQCIPYEVNKELLGTTNNPKEYGNE